MSTTAQPTVARMLSLLPRQQFPNHAKVVARAVELRKLGWRYKRIADQLQGEGWPTARGGKWGSSTVRSLLYKNAPEVAINAIQTERTSAVVNHQLREAIELLDDAIVAHSTAAVLAEEFDKAMAERTAAPNTSGPIERSADE